MDLLTGRGLRYSLPAEAGEGVDEEVKGELVCGPEVNPDVVEQQQQRR